MNSGRVPWDRCASSSWVWRHVAWIGAARRSVFGAQTHRHTLEERALSATILAYNGPALTGKDVPVEAADQLIVGDAHAHVLERNHGASGVAFELRKAGLVVAAVVGERRVAVVMVVVVVVVRGGVGGGGWNWWRGYWS